jgi:hypothetical protein
MNNNLLNFLNSHCEEEFIYSKEKVLSLSQSFLKSISFNQNKDYLYNNKEHLLFSIGTLMIFFNDFTLLQCPKLHQSEGLKLFFKIENDTICKNSFRISEVSFGFGKQLKINLSNITFEYSGTYTAKEIPKYIKLVNELREFLPELSQIQIEDLNNRKNAQREAEQNEKDRIQNLAKNQISILMQLDKDNDGHIDLVDNDFNKLLLKHQKEIIEIDKNYIHKFVKVSNFIKTKKANTQIIFESIQDTSYQNELDELVSLLKNQIHSYELLVFHSINMIGALLSEDLITFYEIYESLDKLGIFNSNWENEVAEKLQNIGDKLDELLYSIYEMEQNIVSELSHLSYITQDSFMELNSNVGKQLKEVESSINTNTLLTGIQTYQLYKMNKNTKY